MWKLVNAMCKPASPICKRATAGCDAANAVGRGVLDRMYGIVRMKRFHKPRRTKDLGKVGGIF